MREAFAALDLGTSRLRVGALLPGGGLTVLASLPNRVERSAGGAARCRFSRQWRGVQRLLDALGVWCRGQRVKRLHLGLCGQVSSLLRWDAAAARPAADDYPIWLDATCAPVLPRLHALWADGGDRRLLGTCMRAGGNWLAAKLLHEGAGDASVVQLSDAVFHRLTGELCSHPSAQISLVDHGSQEYSPGMLAALGVDAGRLPRLAAHGMAGLCPKVAAAHGLPATTVHAGLMDTAAALLGLAPRPDDGLLLAGTSEVIAVWTAEDDPRPPERMVRLRLDQGWALYGSSASGGATLDWLARSLLGRTPAATARLRLAAAAVPAGCDGVRCLPWLDGERAPLWDGALTASFDGLRGHHRDVHLWRAAIEGIAYARRLGAEALERPLPRRFLAAGGGTADPLANRIRASVLGRPLLVFPDAEPALLGVVRHCAAAAGLPDPAPQGPGGAVVVEPEPSWVGTYAAGYAAFTEALCHTR